MSRFIDREMVTVQVETSRTNVWVPDGLAIQQRNYEPGGIAYDCRESGGFAFPEETASRVKGDGWSSRTFESTRTAWVISVNSDGEDQKAMDLGPVLAQTRTPIPVHPGMKVNWGGQFRLRKTGLHNVGNSGTIGGIAVRVAIWGTGLLVDEYGVETEIKIELLAWQNLWQPYVPFVAPNGYVTLTLPAVSDAVVPANVDRVYLSITLIHTTDDLPHTGQYQSFYWVPLDTDFLSVPDAAPVTLYVRKPELVNWTEPNSLSSTGYAFPSRKFFANVPTDAEVVLVATTATYQSVQIWEWTGTERGPRLATVDLPAGGRVVVPISSITGQIEIHCGGPWGVERVTARSYWSLAAEQNHLYRSTFTDIIDEVSTIVSEAIEADLSILTVRFASDTISDTVRAGRRVRLIAKHSAGQTQVFAGVVRGRKVVNSYGRPDQVEIIVHSAHGPLGQVDCPVAYDRLTEYALMVHAAGIPVVIDGVDYTGPPRRLPDGWDYFPSYAADGGQTMVDSLIMARNTQKAFLYVDRLDRVQLRSVLPATVVADLSDVPGQGDMSYSIDNFQSGGDTGSVINAVAVQEHLLDRENYVERVLAREVPPVMFGDIESKTRTVEYRRDSSIELYGLNRRKFDVVRGTGDWSDIVADKFGVPFAAWASSILDAYESDSPTVDKLRLTVTSDVELQLIAGLQVLDAVVVRFRGVSTVRRIRRLDHRIAPNKWTVDVDFTTGPQQAHWLPVTPVPDAGNYLIAASAGRDGGEAYPPLSGTLDGGTP